ncbi:hypothetical protein WMY93_012559 [Mugilogobius chulae]|uniref:L1 transposable element RRM domain-containing protein n=1 Tax=Mugilogobius chulae TaxID=88201 RepID=A0AAW0NXT2_9GOBI
MDIVVDPRNLLSSGEFFYISESFDMPGGEEGGPSKGLRSKKGNVDVEDVGYEDAAMLSEPPSLASIREAINDTMAKSMSEWDIKLSQQLRQLQSNFSEDVKRQLGEIRIEFRQMVEETAGKVEATSRRLDEAEGRIEEVESFGIEVKEYIAALKKTQQELKSKVTELKGHSRRNNIRIYGIKEGTEGTSMVTFVETLLKAELSDSTGLTDLGIERAHRALGPRPAEGAPPRSTLVKFLKYSTKEKIISAAWKKKISVDGQRVFFDHDYATAVMEKRREYLPIKKLLKQNGIRFHTPMTRMRVFLDSGTVTYQSAEQAAEDLRAKGFLISPSPKRNAPERPSLPWERVKEKRSGIQSDYRQRVKDRLQEFHHHSVETAAEETPPSTLT